MKKTLAIGFSVLLITFFALILLKVITNKYIIGSGFLIVACLILIANFIVAKREKNEQK